MSNKIAPKKLSLTTETLRDLSSAELESANGGTSLITFTCNCFNVGGNAPLGGNVGGHRPRLPRKH